MKRVLLASLALLATLASAAQAQLTNFPVYAVPVGGEAPATLVAGGLGRGLNDASGKINIKASIIQPREKKKRVVCLSVPITGPRLRRATKSKLAKSSALPNTAGITVVKLRVVQKAYWRGEKVSAPM